jgi:hypothetical protein
MRDNNEGLPEIIKTTSRDGSFFVIIKVKINEISKTFEIGISQKSFSYIKKILSYHPYDNLPGLVHEYYFVPSISKNSDNMTCKTIFRVVQGKNAKNFEFELTNELFANLLWFFELRNFEKTKYLKEIEENK